MVHDDGIAVVCIVEFDCNVVVVIQHYATLEFAGRPIMRQLVSRAVIDGDIDVTN